MNTIAIGKSGSFRAGEIIRQFSIVVVFFLIVAFFSFASPYFMSWPNWLNLVRQSSINGILAIGVTFVILTKGIDLSVGSVMAIAGMIAASLVTETNEHFVLIGILAGLAVGAGLGLVNGVLVAAIKVPPFVVTLGMLSVARGLTLIFSQGSPIPNLSDAYKWIGSGQVMYIPVPIIILFLVFIIGWVVLNYTTFGRYVYAVGGNEKAARTSGISTKIIVGATYVISGLLAGLAGLVLTASATSSTPSPRSSSAARALQAGVVPCSAL